MTKMLKKVLKDESGATAIEYGLIAGVVAVGLIGALTTLRGNLTGSFTAVGTALTNATNP
jgi:pilus assembly protein Flp/PilA